MLFCTRGMHSTNCQLTISCIISRWLVDIQQSFQQIRNKHSTNCKLTTLLVCPEPRTAPAPRRPAPASPCCGPTGSPGPPHRCGPRRCRPAPSRCPGRSRSRTHRTSSATCCTSGCPQVRTTDTHMCIAYTHTHTKHVHSIHTRSKHVHSIVGLISLLSIKGH